MFCGGVAAIAIRDVAGKYELAAAEMDEANVRYEKMKEEYNLIEGQVEEIDLAIETARTQMNETGLLKQQLEGQINVLKEQINTARMNDEHYGHRESIVQKLSPGRQRKKNWKKRKAECSGKAGKGTWD